MPTVYNYMKEPCMGVGLSNKLAPAARLYSQKADMACMVWLRTLVDCRRCNLSALGMAHSQNPTQYSTQLRDHYHESSGVQRCLGTRPFALRRVWFRD